MNEPAENERPYFFKCPHCGNNREFVRFSEGVPGLGCLFLLTGGFLPALLYAGTTGEQVQCVKCLTTFHRPRIRNSQVSQFALFVWLLTLFVIFGAFVMTVTGIGDLLPDLVLTGWIEAFVIENPRVTSYCIIAGAALLLISSLCVAAWGNWRAFQEVSSKYSVKPPAMSDYTRASSEKLIEEQKAQSNE